MEDDKTAEAHTRRAQQALKAGDLSGARDHARSALAVGVAEAETCFDLGVLLFKLGARPQAEEVLKHGAKRDSSHTRIAVASRYLSALAWSREDKPDARRWIQLAARLSPFEMKGKFNDAKPTLLRIREVDNSHYRLSNSKRTGLKTKILAGGHFSPKVLIGTDFNVIVLNATAQALPDISELPPISLIMNSVACPDMSGSSLHHIGKIIDLFPGVPVINAPEAVLQTSRDKNAARIGALEGVHFPKTHRVSTEGSPSEVIARIEALDVDYPLIVRRPGKQTGRHVAKVENRADLKASLKSAGDVPELYVIQYIDCRDADGLFHKTRCFFIGGHFYPVAHLTNDSWEIHSGDRYRVMSSSEAAQRDEMAYLSDPKTFLGPAVMAGLYKIAEVMQLEYFGIDFTVLPTGDLLIFEANPAMRHNFDHATNFPYTRPHLEKVTEAFQAMMRRKAGIEL